MTELGYSLTSEEHDPNTLVDTAASAEDAGFEFALVSDHYHPWLESQGHSPLVWSTLGGIARETTDLRVGTGVTCPLFRIHPAIIAQATATAGAMHPDEFFLGVGTGENLNEHILGDRWPSLERRLSRLEEAVEIIRELWRGEPYTHYGKFYTVENAKLYTVPDDPPPLYVAAEGAKSVDVASRIGDGLISNGLKEEVVETFESKGDGDRPKYGQISVCWAESESEGRETAYQQWRNTALPGELSQKLSTPAHFEQATQLVDVDDVAESVTCGNDPDEHIEMIEQFFDVGFDYVSVNQIGPEQEECLAFYEEQVLPSFA